MDYQGDEIRKYKHFEFQVLKQNEKIQKLEKKKI